MSKEKVSDFKKLMVECFVCKGLKIIPYSNSVCKCCNGLGKITKEAYEIKLKISRDIIRRLKLIQ